MQQHVDSSIEPARPRGWLSRWHATPLYLRILGAVELGLATGVIFGAQAASALEVPARLVLRVLTGAPSA
jgi:hypothetical protein